MIDLKNNINPGEFHHQIEIRRFIEGEIDENGIPNDTWKTIYLTRAKVSNESGREFAQRTGMSGDYSKRIIKLWFRSHPKLAIKESDTLIYNGLEWDISYVNDYNDRKILTELVAERTV